MFYESNRGNIVGVKKSEYAKSRSRYGLGYVYMPIEILPNMSVSSFMRYLKRKGSTM